VSVASSDSPGPGFFGSPGQAISSSRQIFFAMKSLMSRNRGYFPGGSIHIHGVPPAFAKKGTAAGFKMTNQIDSLHQEAISKGSRSTSLPSKACSVNSRFASRTS